MIDEERIIEVLYTNYRGETRNRKIDPLFMWFGTSEHHEGNQWFLHAEDVDRSVIRDFALKDCVFDKRFFMGVRSVSDTNMESDGIARSSPTYIRNGRSINE